MSIAYTQKVEIDTLRFNENKEYRSISSGKINFPIVRTGSKKVDSIINFDLKNEITSNEYADSSIESTLLQWTESIINSLDFKITYNDNGILSLNITTEGCGSYCTYMTNYFNYSTITGKPIDISEIIDTTGAFKTLVYQDKKAQFEQSKKDLKEMRNNPELEVDQTIYELALEYYLNCENSFDFKTFALYPNQLEIIQPCSLPNAIKNLTPILSFKYDNSIIKNYLKIKNLLD